MNDRERLKNCSRLKETKETQQPNAVRDPAMDQEKTLVAKLE